MRIGAVVAGLAVAIGAMYGVVWVFETVVKATVGIKTNEPIKSTLKINKDGPQPKAVVDETEHKFGAMELGEERTHAFVIRNEGQAPLKLEKGPTTCQCTISEVPNDEIPPGGSTKIVLTWKPTAETDSFNKGATIFTNEPNEKGEQKKIELSITGVVAPRLRLSPTGDWTVAEVREAATSTYTGSIYSPVLDAFEILAIESGSPHVTATSEPMSEEALKENSAKCGYSIHVAVSPEVPVGSFSYPITIKTGVPHRLPEDKAKEPGAAPPPNTEMKVMITGQRRGPIRMLGTDWIEEKMVANLGGFSHTMGKKITLSMLVATPPAEGLKLEAPVSDPAFLKAEFEPQENFKGSARMYRVHLEVPPGSPPTNRTASNLARVKVRTNHPLAPEIQFDVSFNAY